MSEYKMLHEKLTMFTSAQHLPPCQDAQYVHMIHVRACLKSQQPLLLLCPVVIPISKHVKPEYVLQSLPVNFDLQHLAPAKLVLRHTI